MKPQFAVAAAAILALLLPPVVSAQPDVGVTAIIQPTDTIAPGYITPQAQVANLGDSNDSTRAWFTVERPGGGFSESFSDTLVFPPTGWLVRNVDGLTSQWRVGTAGTNTPPGCAVANTEPGLAGNDDWLITPRVKVNPSDTITFWYRALGSFPESLEVWVSYTDTAITSFTEAIQAWDFDSTSWDVGWADFHAIGDTSVYIGFRYKAAPGRIRTGAALDDIRLKTVLYSEATRLLVAPGVSAVASFANWRDRVGHYVARCSVYQAGDANPANDVRTRNVAVVEPPPPPANWTEMESMPRAPSGRDVKHGGSLVFQEADGMLYAVKGNKTGDFYRFNPPTNSWVQLQPVPDGPSGRSVKKGACLAADGERFVYLVKGNNTIEFWRYDPDSFGWQQRADIPAEPSGKRVKGGGDAAFVTAGGSDYIYLLKGYRQDFMRYDIQLDRWDQLAQAPVGPAGKWRQGSFLAWDRGDQLYAHQAKKHALWRYDIAGDTWEKRVFRSMPYEGRHGSGIRSKKLKDGGSAVWRDNQLFALKGGNTQMFYRYDIATDVWTELDTLPRAGSSGRRRRVSAGGDLVAADNQLYALKGNKTRELWRFTIGAAAGPKPEQGGAQNQGRLPIADSKLQMDPNPASGFATLRYSLPKASPATVRVFDAAGREVLSRGVPATRSGAVNLDLRSLSAGIYLVKVEADGFTGTQKLVIQH